LIKVCGITRAQDALAAARLGVHALGFVLWPASPRAVSLEAMRAIVGQLPPFVTPVGVFVDPGADQIARARDAGIQVAQIHGTVPTLPGGMPLLRAVSLDPSGGGTIPLVPGQSALLIDALDPVRRGGTGRTLDWARVRAVSATRPVILAGGLTPENVKAAMCEAAPCGVDVSSGVEESPGLKDHGKLAAFVSAVSTHHEQ
jgi:phosphoribosylanthranilate isomerase